MTIFIDNEKITYKRAKFISRPDDLAKQNVRAWCRANTGHCFESKKSFKKAVRRNRKTLGSPETLFTSRNYLFSTKAKHRKETLYFKDRATKQTGRLRQQHRSGPLAKIDKNAKRHRFVSEERYKFLKKWHEKHPKQLPKFYSCEQRAKVGKCHIEFAFNKENAPGWHASEGTVETTRQGLDHRIASALENILGIRRNKTKK